jgi:hypothetical protein
MIDVIFVLVMFWLLIFAVLSLAWRKKINNVLREYEARLKPCENGTITALMEILAINARLDGVNAKNIKGFGDDQKGNIE